MSHLTDPKKSSLAEEESTPNSVSRRVDVRKSLRRVEQPRRHSHTSLKPIELQMSSPTGRVSCTSDHNGSNYSTDYSIIWIWLHLQKGEFCNFCKDNRNKNIASLQIYFQSTDISRCLCTFLKFTSGILWSQFHSSNCTHSEPPLMAAYKLNGRDRDRNHSEPESGYRTDGSTTYSQIEDRVSDIQLKVIILLEAVWRSG